MNTMNEDKLNLKDVIKSDDDQNLINDFSYYLKNNLASSIKPGLNSQLDSSLWEAAKFSQLTAEDEGLLNRVTGNLLKNIKVEETVFSFKEFFNQANSQVQNIWSDLLQTMQWQVLTPVAITRSVASDEALSLGTFTQSIANIGNIEMNLNFYNKTNSIKLLVQATDLNGEALTDTKVMISKDFSQIIYEGQTNEDGFMLEPNIELGNGIFQIDFLVNDNLVSTPIFKI